MLPAHPMRTRRYLPLALAALLAACADRAPTGPVTPGGEAVRSLASGPQIIINEILADPSAVADSDGEWLEVHNWGDASANLQGWTLSSGNDAAVTISASVTVAPGGYAILARNGTTASNGGVTAQFAYGTAINLANGADWLRLQNSSGVTVDSVAWSSASAGASRGVKDPSVDNTLLSGANWQLTAIGTTFGGGDRGTPGAQNTGYVAPVASITLSPAPVGIALGGTQPLTVAALDAQGGPLSPTLVWTTTNAAVATVDATGLVIGQSAGTATIRATAPNGAYGEAVVTVDAAPAKLILNELIPNPGAVADGDGEWLEIHNWGTAAANLKGWSLASGSDAGTTIATSIVVPAGGYVVLGRNGNTATNGGVTVHYAYGSALNLANSTDWAALRDGRGLTADSVAWTSVPTAASRGVKDPAADNTLVGGTNWSTQIALFGGGDRGTPGAENDGYVSPVPPGPPVTVVMAPPSANIELGTGILLGATARDSANRVSPTTFTWTTSNPSVATVGSNGQVTTVATGTATIRATASNAVYGEATITVVPSTAGTPGELVVRVLDIGQGDANLITNGGSTVLIDGGPDPVRMGALLDSLGLNGDTIDVVILSHQHYDHHSGLRSLFEASRGITVRYFFENQDAYTNTALSELRDSVAARVSRGETVLRDTDDPCGNSQAVCTVTLNGGAKLHVMRPHPTSTHPNDRSVPVKLVGPDSASFSMWFAGDAEHEAIDWFDTGANYDAFPGMDVDVLKADHHGSCNGVKSRYLDLLTPSWVTFSLEAENDYGHVHNQTKTLFTQYGKPWYRTDQNGTITIRTPGTVGGGFTIQVQAGVASSSGPVDRASSQVACSSL